MVSPVIPCLRYADAPAAIDFLCNAFGFTRQAVFLDEADPRIVAHAQLTLGTGMVMLGSVRPAAAGASEHWRTAAQLGGVSMVIYVVVADPDAHHAIAAAQGATILCPPHDNEGYPGRGYEARDPEGNDWSFGSYAP